MVQFGMAWEINIKYNAMSHWSTQLLKLTGKSTKTGKYDWHYVTSSLLMLPFLITAATTQTAL